MLGTVVPASTRGMGSTGGASSTSLIGTGLVVGAAGSGVGAGRGALSAGAETGGVDGVREEASAGGVFV